MEKKVKKERVKCPVCGMFVSKETAERYNDLLQDREGLESLIARLTEQCNERDAKINELLDDMESVMAYNDRLRSRGLWARVFNKD